MSSAAVAVVVLKNQEKKAGQTRSNSRSDAEARRFYLEQAQASAVFQQAPVILVRLEVHAITAVKALEAKQLEVLLRVRGEELVTMKATKQKKPVLSRMFGCLGTSSVPEEEPRETPAQSSEPVQLEEEWKTESTDSDFKETSKPKDEVALEEVETLDTLPNGEAVHDDSLRIGFKPVEFIYPGSCDFRVELQTSRMLFREVLGVGHLELPRVAEARDVSIYATRKGRSLGPRADDLLCTLRVDFFYEKSTVREAGKRGLKLPETFL